MILIDVGSSSVKVYDGAKLINTKTLLLKSDFVTAKADLYKFILEIQKNYHDIRVYGTALFRKLDSETQSAFLTEFKAKTDLEFTIISQDDESLYLQQALINKYAGTALLINIGGGSTELVVVKNKKAIERQNVDLGVVALLKQFPTINNSLSGISLREVKKFIKGKLPQLKHKVSIAFYSGGELRYMRLAKYPLKSNNLFSDPEHPSLISFADFSQRNAEVFQSVPLQDLEKLMPDDPAWMHGARACSAFAESICEKYQITSLVPSNSNLVNGIINSV